MLTCRPDHPSRRRHRKHSRGGVVFPRGEVEASFDRLRRGPSTSLRRGLSTKLRTRRYLRPFFAASSEAIQYAFDPM